MFDLLFHIQLWIDFLLLWANISTLSAFQVWILCCIHSYMFPTCEQKSKALCDRRLFQSCGETTSLRPWRDGLSLAGCGHVDRPRRGVTEQSIQGWQPHALVDKVKSAWKCGSDWKNSLICPLPQHSMHRMESCHPSQELTHGSALSCDTVGSGHLQLQRLLKQCCPHSLGSCCSALHKTHRWGRPCRLLPILGLYCGCICCSMLLIQEGVCGFFGVSAMVKMLFWLTVQMWNIRAFRKQISGEEARRVEPSQHIWYLRASCFTPRPKTSRSTSSFVIASIPPRGVWSG